MKFRSFNYNLMFGIGLILVIVGLFGGGYFDKVVWQDYSTYKNALEQMREKLDPQSVEIKALIKKRNESLIELIVINFIMALALFAVFVFLYIKYWKYNRWEKQIEKISKDKEINAIIKSLSSEEKSDVYKVLVNINNHIISHKNEKGLFDISQLPEPAIFIEPIKVKSESNIIFLRWFSLTAVLMGLIGTMLSLVWAISGAIEALNVSTGNIIEGFKSALEPLRFAFYCSVAGVYSGFTLNLFRILADSQIETLFANMEIKLAEFIPVVYRKNGFDLPENKMIELAGEMKKLNSNINSLMYTTQVIVSKLNNEIVKTFNDNIKGMNERLSNLFEQNFKQVIDHFNSSINSNLVEKLNEINKEYKEHIIKSSDDLRLDYSSLRNSINDLNEKLKSNITNVQTSIDSGNTLISEYKSIVSNLSQQVSEELPNKIKSINAELVSNTNTLIGKIGENISTFTKELKDELTNKLGDIKKSNNEIITVGQQLVRGMITGMDGIISDFTTNLKTELDDKIKEIKNSSESINNEFKNLLTDNFNKLSEIQNSVEQNLGEAVPNKIVELSKNLNFELYNMNKTLIDENKKFINEVKKQFVDITSSFTSNEENIKNISKGVTELSGKITEYNTAIDSLTQKYNSNISTIEGGINKIIEFLKNSKEFYTLEEGTLDKVRVFNKEFEEFTQEVKKFNTQFANAVNNISGILSGLQGEEVKETISTIGKVNKDLKKFLDNISDIEKLLNDQKLSELLEQQRKYLENIEKLNSAILSTLSYISSNIGTGDGTNNFSNDKENG